MQPQPATRPAPSTRRQVTWQPAFKDGYTAEGNTVELSRDGRGRVTALLVTPGRSRNIRFERVR